MELNQTAVNELIEAMPFPGSYLELDDAIKPKLVTECWNMLRRRYGAAVITDEMVALQTVYIAEGEKEEFAKFKRQSVKSMNVEGLSFSFDLNHVSPEVVALIDQINDGGAGESGAIFGRFY